MSTVAPARPAPPIGERFAWSPLLVVLAGTFMTFLDFFIVNVALPSIHTELHADAGEVQLVVAGYGLAFAVGMVSGGRLGDLFGRRRMFALGLALFTLTSAGCGLAPTAGVLLTARVLQGVAGALLTPQVLAILSTIYSGKQRARAFAAYGFAMGIAGVLGQLVGGALISADIDGSGWRGIFLINVPVGLLALAFVRVIPESRGGRDRLDLVGTALITVGLVAIVAPLVEGREQGWPVWTWVSFAVAPIVLGLFVAQQRDRRRRGEAPLVDLSLFGLQAFRVGSLAGFTFGLVPPAFFFVLALYLQQGRGYSPLFSGVVFTAVGVGYFAAMLVAGRIGARLGRQVLALGAVLVGFGAVILAACASVGSALELTPGLALVGFGIGLVLVPLSATVLGQVPAANAGAAAGVLSTSLQIGGAFGVAVIGVVFYAALGTGTALGTAHAFTVALWVLGGLTALTALIVQALPGAVSAT